MATAVIPMLLGGEIDRSAGDLPGALLLTSDDYRRILAVLEVGWRSIDSPSFRPTLLDALNEFLGLRASAFFFAPTPSPGFRAVDGVLPGYASKGVEEYVERWSKCEPPASPAARALLRSHGIASLDRFFGRLDDTHRRYVEDFFLPHRIRCHTNLWLDTGLPRTAWISILRDCDEPLSPRVRAVYSTLRPHLAELVRRTVMNGGHGDAVSSLTARELEVAKLVAQGKANQSIAHHLGVAEDTVKKHVSAAMRKMQVSNRTALALTVS
jgi:DNA-binding CsgD family transcriptional regulator